MRKNKGITLMTLIITIMILSIISVTIYFSLNDTYNKSKVVKFQSYMKMIQKGVDLAVEEGKDYTTMGKSLNDSEKEKLKTILDNDSNNYIETNDVSSDTLRLFNNEEIYEYFGVADVYDTIIVNFANREIISLNGVEKDGVIHYVERGLN